MTAVFGVRGSFDETMRIEVYAITKPLGTRIGADHHKEVFDCKPIEERGAIVGQEFLQALP